MATLTPSIALGTDWLNSIRTRLNAGGAGNPATIALYNGTKPARPDTAITTQTKLGTATRSDDCGTVSTISDVPTLTFAAITADSAADNSGVVSWGRASCGGTPDRCSRLRHLVDRWGRVRADEHDEHCRRRPDRCTLRYHHGRHELHRTPGNAVNFAFDGASYTAPAGDAVHLSFTPDEITISGSGAIALLGEATFAHGTVVVSSGTVSLSGQRTVSRFVARRGANRRRCFACRQRASERKRSHRAVWCHGDPD